MAKILLCISEDFGILMAAIFKIAQIGNFVPRPKDQMLAFQFVYSL